jgi:2-methylisocitrate lyase-like PEP mutase family enzyme
MTALSQKETASQFRHMHVNPPLLILPNAWDAASARVFERAGFRAIATTSSGVAAALGYPDGQQISRDILVEVVEHIARVIACPLTVDIEAGYGKSVEEVLETVKAVVAAGAVGINIEDSRLQQTRVMVDVVYQAELITAMRALARSMDIPFVVNARTDVFLLPGGDSAGRFREAAGRLNSYRQAGADCLFPIGVNDARTVTALVKAVNGPINILAGSHTSPLAELAQMRVARVSFGSCFMRAALAQLQHIIHEMLTEGTYTSMSERMLSGAEFRSLFA